ncbi:MULTISPECIES: hypothetical protein [unclassified Anabaena]
MGCGIYAGNAIAQGISKVSVAAIFHPQCLIAHPNTAINIFSNLKG